jgi:peptide chain release factor subunit 1
MYLRSSDIFDARLRAVIIKMVDVSYGGENGFNQAIENSADALQDVKFLKEKKLIGQYFEEIATDTGRYCFGIADTLRVCIYPSPSALGTSPAGRVG